MHYLDLFIPTHTSLNSFEIRDVSLYDSHIPVTNAILEVFPPSSENHGYVGHKAKGFSVIINSYMLKLSTSAGAHPPLPDGVYRIKYSVKPNDKAFVDFLYFRNAEQVDSLMKAASNLLKNQCMYSRRFFSQKQKELLWLRQLIDSAKYEAEENRDECKAIELYNEATLLLKSFKC